MKIRFKKTKDKTEKELKTEIKLYSFFAILVLAIGSLSILMMINAKADPMMPLGFAALMVSVTAYYLIDIQGNNIELRIREAVLEAKKNA